MTGMRGEGHKIDFLIILYNPNKLGAAIKFAGVRSF